jgi:hypothetical protein
MMARYGIPHRALVAALLTGTLTVGGGAWTSAQQPPSGGGQRRAVLVRLSNVGLERSPSDSVQVIVYTTGPARVGVGNADPTPLTDTLRLSSLSTITADVSDADVHIRLLTPGRMRLSAEVSGGRALRFTATGRHVVVLKGGVGADTITDP